ncbi:MAG: rhomboid family serine protease [Ktedonobacterales bacterium]|jgi:membrane associated rhomboid family serine protease|nr:MAG: rhomboid family serine protease [Ktedonobacterales bacterium]
MIPLSDDPGVRRRIPFVNYTLIAINVAAFILEYTQGTCFQLAYSAVPYGIVHGVSLPIQGCPYGQAAPVYVTLLTAMFLHAGLLHIAGNMLFLWIFGDNVEDRLGHVGYLVFYLFCGFVASAAQIAVDPNSTIPTLGASGAIAGVLGAYIVFYPGARVRTLIFLGFFITMARLSALIVIGMWFVLQLADAFLSQPVSQGGGGVAYFAHIGGFVAGLLIALLVRPFTKPPKPNATSYPYWPAHQDMRRMG